MRTRAASCYCTANSCAPHVFCVDFQSQLVRTVSYGILTLVLNISHKCYDWGLKAPYDLNSHGARTVAVEPHGRREMFWTIFIHRTMNRSF